MIENAFAIHAAPDRIFAALEEEVGAAGNADEFEVVRRQPNRELELRVVLGGIDCWLTYRLTPKLDHTEVVATLVPFGWRYTLFKIMTLGMRDQNFAIVLVQALSNLKEHVEGPHPEQNEDEGA